MRRINYGSTCIYYKNDLLLYIYFYHYPGNCRRRQYFQSVYTVVDNFDWLGTEQNIKY